MDWNTIIEVKPPYISQLAGLIGRSISFLNRVVWKVMSSPESDNYFSKSCAQSPALHVGLYGKTIKDEVTLIAIRNIAYGKIIMVQQFGLTS